MGTYYRNKIDFYVENYVTDYGKTIPAIGIYVSGEEIAHAESLEQAVKMFDGWFKVEREDEGT